VIEQIQISLKDRGGEVCGGEAHGTKVGKTRFREPGLRSMLEIDV